MPRVRRGMTELEYARHSGLPDGVLSMMKKRGLLVLFPDGSIDAAGSDVKRAQDADPGRQLQVQRIKEAEGRRITFVEARTEHEIVKSKRAELQLERERGDVVDREKARQTVMALAMQERDAWVGWPARIAPDLAVELGVDAQALQICLDRALNDHLRSLAEIDPKIA